MPHLITSENLDDVKFHVKDTSTFGKMGCMDSLSANISVTAGSDVCSKQIFLSDVVCSYCSRQNQKYYREYITVGIPDSVWDKIWLSAGRTGINVKHKQTSISYSDEYAWLEVSLLDNENTFYVVDGEQVKYEVVDIGHFFNSLKRSLLTKMLCTMRMKWDSANSGGWSLDITPVEFYIVDTSPYRYRQRDVVDPSLCCMDVDFEGTFMPMMMGRVRQMNEDSWARRHGRRKGGSSKGLQVRRRAKDAEDGGSGGYGDSNEDEENEEWSNEGEEKFEEEFERYVMANSDRSDEDV